MKKNLDYDTLFLIAYFLVGFGVIGLILANIPMDSTSALAIFFAGIVFDVLSTYLLTKTAGMHTFYCYETNKTAKVCVKKFGLGKGLLISKIHPKIIFCGFWIIVSCGLIEFATHGNTGLLNFATPGILFIGLIQILASGSNFYQLRIELQSRTLDEIKEEI